MPVTFTCITDAAEASNLAECRVHEAAEHGGAPAEWTVRVARHPGAQRRTWSCARCARQVAREDDGSLLCDACKASGPLPPARLLPRGEAHGGRGDR